MTLRGELRGHSGWVTAIATTEPIPGSGAPPKLLSASRGSYMVHRTRSRDSCTNTEVVVCVSVFFFASPSAKSMADKTIIVWELQDTDHGDMGDGVVPLAGVPKRCLCGHSHFVEDVVISSDGQFALSASWDHTLRLWDIKKGSTTRRFVGHTKDVLSCAFSAENRQIVSGSRDKTVKLWNTLVRPCAIFFMHFRAVNMRGFSV